MPLPTPKAPPPSISSSPLATPIAQFDETDPPPYIPSSNDRVSLNQKTCPQRLCVEEEDRHSARVVANLGLLIPTQIRLKTPEVLPTPSSGKTGAAGSALTRTSVHEYKPDDSRTERRQSTSDSGRRRSATLQVVRSRNSVYEVIWEDVLVTCGSLSPQSPLNYNSGSYSGAFHLNTGGVSNTNLKAFSWDRGIGTQRECVQSEAPNSPDWPSLRQRQISGRDALHLLAALSELDIPANEHTQSCTFSEPASASASESTMQANWNLEHQHQLQLVGPRKLSNLTAEENNFALHRDSLGLAHKRICHERPYPKP